MKKLNTTKILLSAAVAASLSACGGSDSNSKSSANNAPTHNGNLSVTVSENDRASTINLLNGATDLDAGDALRVRDLTTTEADLSGITENFFQITVTPSAYKDSLDSGETKEIVYTYSVSDGKQDTPRTLTIAIEGYDEAPEFSNLTRTFSEEAGSRTYNLLEGATDADGETLSVANFSQAETNIDGAATYANGSVTIDASVFADDIKGGDTVTFVFNYEVADHNHSLPRTLTVNVTGVSTEPEPPTVNDTITATMSTADSQVMVDLVASPEIIDWNGDDVTADLSTLTPVDDAPAFNFALSSGNTLVVEPVAFYSRLAEAETKSFAYTYTVSDPGGLTAQATVSLSVTKDAVAAHNVMPNASFEDGTMAGWTQAPTQADGTEVENFAAVVTDAANAKQGTNYMQVTGDVKLSYDLTGLLEQGSSYYVELPARDKSWGNWYGSISEGLTLLTERFRFSDHGWNPGIYLSHTGTFTVDDRYVEPALKIESAGNLKLDDIRLVKYAFEQANNILSEQDSTFEDGSAGNWILGGNSTISNTTVIDGDYSIYATGGGANDIVMPAGSIQNGKRYLLEFDIYSPDFAPDNHPTRAWILDSTAVDGSGNPINTNAEVFASTAEWRTIRFLDAATVRWSMIFDIDHTSHLDDWATRETMLRLETNIWGQGYTYAIDNVRLIEIP
ncbi:cadherin-like domain-containing protein [Saccharophagus degradans]|uniref:Cadherin-like domain-containing protein n=1 Tax=Saccharophagus degradans TaxID=86304 RepID=A0AAW7XCB2_9GAMM|nr:cadherin-like domain-containing protein [Saccharophagus degradans]MDO6424591.1 cadherin-like domain-containing protein [Saccharophagus degradans]MDO6608924.1 cadherin-like domain-containing protein [Saccharophagus degradans]